VLALSRHTFGKDPLKFFNDLPEIIGRNENGWKEWIEKNDPEKDPIPDPQTVDRLNGEKEVGAFMKLCLIRGLREDRTLVAASGEG